MRHDLFAAHVASDQETAVVVLRSWYWLPEVTYHRRGRFYEVRLAAQAIGKVGRHRTGWYAQVAEGPCSARRWTGFRTRVEAAYHLVSRRRAEVHP